MVGGIYPCHCKVGIIYLMVVLGANLIINSDLLNYLSKRGWRYAGLHFPEKSIHTEYHYVMYKEVTDDEQIKEGIFLKE